MEGFIMAGQLLLGLGLLVFIHELGHFLAARAFGIKIEKFYIFFDFGDFVLFRKKIGDTEYGLGWFPLGGYVKIAGMIDESFDKEQLEQEPKDWEFRSKPAWQRFIVMMAGIFMNVIFGIIIFAFWLSYYEKAYIAPKDIPEGIYAYSLGRELGFQNGDLVISIDGDSIERTRDFLQSNALFFEPTISVLRKGELVNIELPHKLEVKFREAKTGFLGFENFPVVIDSVVMYKGIGKQKKKTIAHEIGLKKGDKLIGVNSVSTSVYGAFREELINNRGTTVDLMVLRETDTLLLKAPLDSINPKIGFLPHNPYIGKGTPYTFASSIVFGTKEGFRAMLHNAIGLGQIFTGKRDASKSIQSPIGIARIYGGTWDWYRFWQLTGLISFILAFMNFLPIPALDGGHVMFIIIEVIQGKPVGEKTLERAQIFGIVVIMALMLFAFGNDIYKLIFGTA